MCRSEIKERESKRRRHGNRGWVYPKAGMPHAELFALLEACGAVRDGVEAATSILLSNYDLSSGKWFSNFVWYKSNGSRR
jgi:hypothetical protein